MYNAIFTRHRQIELIHDGLSMDDVKQICIEDCLGAFVYQDGVFIGFVNPLGNMVNPDHQWVAFMELQVRDHL